MTNRDRGLLLLVIIFGFIGVSFLNSHNELENSYYESQEDEIQKLSDIKQKLDQVPIQAEAVAIKNLSTGEIIYGRKDEKVLPLASLSKIITVAVVLNNQNKDDLVRITSEAIIMPGYAGLIPNEQWQVDELSKLALVASSNDATTALTQDDDRFVDKMNAKVKRLGLTNMNFSNPTGLDSSPGKPSAVGTAKEVNEMLDYAYKSFPEILESTKLSKASFYSTNGRKHQVDNTNILTDQIPNLLVSKTGYTRTAGGNLAVIFTDAKGDNIAITALGSTMVQRFYDIVKMANAVYNL